MCRCMDSLTFLTIASSFRCGASTFHRSFLMVFAVCCSLCLLSSETYAARVVAEKRECAICHVAWIADFKRSDIKTLIPYDPRPNVKTGRQDVVSTERMCFSCHDGFVLDSRFFWQNQEHTHPVGVVPSDKVHIPVEEGKTIFPLNDEGKVYCGTCHSAHGVEWGDKLSTVFLRTQNIDSSLCMTCHIDRKDEQDGHLNHPLNKEVPKEAKKLLASGSKFTRNNEVICQSCHRVHASQEEKLLVVKNESSQLCANCHMDKSDKQQKGEKKHFTHPVDIVAKDAIIPEKFAASGSLFGPDEELICQTCHEVHLAPSEKLLVLEDEHLTEGICVNCHDDKRSLLASGHNLLRDEAAPLSKAIKMPSRNMGVCGVCHQIHNGSGPKMWARDLSAGGDRVASLCLSCHTDGAPAEKHQVGKFSHPVGAPLPASAKPGDLPLFTASGAKTHSTRKGRVSCPTCHDVHGPASTQKTKSSGKMDKSGVGKYLRKGEGDLMVLCKRCHDDKWSIADTKHNIEASKQDSMPLGVCGSCHQVHNGKGPRIWTREGDLRESDPGSLCLSCHKKDGLAEKKLLGDHSHPVGVSIDKAGVKVTSKGWVTDDGGKKSIKASKLPLYDNKGNSVRQGSGRVVCATCHDPHKWSSDKDPKPTGDTDTEEGDASNSFLRIPAAPDGELCVTCHTSKKWVRGTEHDLSVTVPEARNDLGEGLDQSGVCGQCHAVHNAVQDLVLWGRPLGQAGNTPEMLCRSCHLPGEIAQAKVPERATHPSYVMAWDDSLHNPDIKGSTPLPVFSNDGTESVTGYITCPTCHNVHKWQADRAEAGPGKNVEGDVFSSFLRLESTEGMLCADCHGPDSLFRYKYFHGTNFNNEQGN